MLTKLNRAVIFARNYKTRCNERPHYAGLLGFILVMSVQLGYSQAALKTKAVTWQISELLTEDVMSSAISGQPAIVASPFGEAVHFNGIDDALFLDAMPLKGLTSFTIEMIFSPDDDGDFEQRILHIGEVSDDSMLLEIRNENAQWYFDGFVKSKHEKKALIDERLQHTTQAWYHVALVVTPNSLSTYVNGKQELTETFHFSPIQTGQTSIGVRLNKKSWFKGSIYSITISPDVLDSSAFNLPLAITSPN